MKRFSDSTSAVDATQVRALLRVGLQSDWRSGRLGQGFGSRGGRAWSFVASVLTLKLLIGATVAALVVISSDRFLPASLYFTLVIFAVASSVVLDFPTVVISPDDHAMLAHLPVSSQTFLLARLLRLLIYVALVTAPLALLPCLSLAFAGGFSVARLLAAAMATVGAAFGTALAIVALYTTLQQRIPRARQRAALTVLQLGLGLALYGSVVVVPALVDDLLKRGSIAGRPWWLILTPGSWFASWIEIAGGGSGWLEVGTATVSLLGIAGLVCLVRGRLSLEYAEALSDVGVDSEVRSTPTPLSSAVRAWLGRVLPSRFVRHEGRAVGLLVRAQFRFDQRFRLAVLGIAPLTLVYLVAGVVMDAQEAGRSVLGRPRLYHFAVMLFPVMLQQSLIRSEAYQAAWVYRATPTSAVTLLLALKDLVFGYFVVPYLLIVGIAAWAVLGSGTSLPLGLVTTGLVSHVFLLGALCMEPRLPFSIPSRRPAEGRALMGIMLATAAAGQALGPVLDAMTTSLRTAAVVLMGLAAANVVLRRVLLVRVRSAERRGLYDL